MFEEAHFAWFPNYARTSVAAVSEIISTTMSKLPITQMHPSFVHTAPTQQKEQQTIASLRPSFAPITCNSTIPPPMATVKPFGGTQTDLPKLLDVFTLPQSHITYNSVSDTDSNTAAIANISANTLPQPTYLTRPTLSLTRSADSVTMSVPETYTLDRKHIIAGSASGLLCLLCADGYWSTVEVPLSGITPDVEILALHTFEKAITSNWTDVVRKFPSFTAKPFARTSNIITAVGTAQVTTQGSKTYALHLYGSLSSGATLEKKLFSLASDCHIVSLAYAPLLIKSVTIASNHRRIAALLVTGSDRKVHLYAENPISRKFSEVKLKRHFPSLDDITHLVTCLCIHPVNEHTRIVICACENGDVAAVLETFNEAMEIINSQTAEYHFYSPISSTLVYSEIIDNHCKCHLIITPTIEPTIVVRNLLILNTNEQNHELSSIQVTSDSTTVNMQRLPEFNVSINQSNRHSNKIHFNSVDTHTIELPDSHQHESVLCVHIMDTTWTGQLDILLGTFGQRVLIYRYDYTSQQYNLVHIHRFPYPIYHITSTDLNQDGLDELVVTSMFGVHILQHDLTLAKKRLIEQVFPEVEQVLALREELKKLTSI